MTTKPKRRGPAPLPFTARAETRLDPATLREARRVARLRGVSLGAFIRSAVKSEIIAADRAQKEVQP